jgi:CRP-like cAMP-binding protein
MQPLSLSDRDRLAQRTETEHVDPQGELRAVPTLSELPREAMAELAVLASPRREPLGAVLSEQGSTAQRLDILLRGAVKLVRTTQHALGETTVVLDVARGPTILPTMSLFDGQPELASIVALRTAHLVSVDRRVVLRLAAQHPSFQRALLVHLSQMGRRHVRRIDEVASGPVDERVRHLLEDLAAQHGTAFGHGRFIAIPLRRKDIACMVNATTETVSRVLARFEREGLTRSTRDGIWLRGAASPTRSAQVQEGDSGALASSSRGAR